MCSAADRCDNFTQVLRSDEVTIYASDTAGMAEQYPNIQGFIDGPQR